MGYNILVVSQRLGHKSVKVTLDTYGHLYPGASEKVAFGLQEAKYTGITQNVTAEQQVLALLTEIKQTMVPYEDLKNDAIVCYNPIEHVKYFLEREQFNDEIAERGMNPELQFAEMVYSGYLEASKNTVYCFASKGMPVQFL